MPSIDNTENGNKSGIITSDSGERHIPSSLRPDGTKRKEIKIRPGYRPPEDVEVYKNRTAEAWKTRGTGGIPGAGGLQSESMAGDSKTMNNKNIKRREARRKAKASEDNKGETDGSEQQGEESAAQVSSPKANGNGTENSKTVPADTEPTELDPDAEKEKLARNLKKKLRQARELREKKDKGDSLLPEQFEKVIKINELIRQLDSLGFDVEGEPKTDT